MKRLLISVCLCLCLLLTDQASAWMGAVGVGQGVGGVATTAYCTGAATCTATSPGQCDLMCEDFEGALECDSDSNPNMDAVCRNQYAVSATPTIDFTATAVGTYLCSGTTNTNVAQFESGSALFDTGGSLISYLQFWFAVTSESITNGNYQSMIKACANATCSSMAYMIGIHDTSGTIYPRLRFVNATPANTDDVGGTALTLNTWHRVNVKWDYTNSAVEWWVDGVSEGSWNNPINRPARYLLIGPTSTAYALTFQLDNIAYDDDTIQGDCN